MAKFDVTQPQQRDGDNEWTPLATGQYLMKIAGAKIAPSPFAEKQTDFATGQEVEVFPDRLSITWKLSDWNEEYAEAGYEAGQKVFQQFNPWYGESKKGPSKFKQFIDPLITEGLIPAQFEIAEKDMPETDGDLIGITRSVMVENYAKTMGPNKGQPGNRVLAVTAPRTIRSTVKEVIKNGGRVDLAEVDASDTTLIPPRDSDGATHAEMLSYAKSLAKECGGMWASKTDWDQASGGILRMRIARMETQLSEPVTVEAETEALF